MRKIGGALAAAALLAMAQPATARADVFNLGSFCGGNALMTCSAVQLSTTSVGPTNFLRIDVLNLSGWMGTPENTVYTKIGLNGLGLSGVANLQVSFDNGGSWQAADGYGWGLETGSFGASFTAENFATNGGNNSNPGIASACAQSLPGAVTAQWITPGCNDGSVDYSQAVAFRFTFTGMTNSLGDASVLIRGQNAGFGDDTGGSLVCDTATNCTTTVTPEPTTMILLGTGLAGLVGAARRRRNGGEIETEDEADALV